MGWGATVVALLAALLAGSCSGGDLGPAAPSIDDATASELRARAIWRACGDAVCPDGPVLVDADMPDEVGVELTRYAEEIRHVDPAEAEAMAPAGERFPGGAILFDAMRPAATGRRDIIGVDVSIRRGPTELAGRRYLFRWDGTAWVDESSDAVGMTLTTAAS